MKFYLCIECKKVVRDLEQVYLVEDGQYFTYCSEDCVKNFFDPLKKWFQNEETQAREEFSLGNESDLPDKENLDFLQKSLKEKNSVYEIENEFGLCLTSFVGMVDWKGGKVHSLLICLMYEERPSLILFQTYSKNADLIKKLTIGTLLTNEKMLQRSQKTEGDNEIEMDQESFEHLEQKKSRLLADLLENRLESDIAYEKFNLYDVYLSQTLDEPDEIYQWKSEGDDLFSYIRSFNVEGTSFYYIAICVHHAFDEEAAEEILLPVISFPTLDAQLYRRYAKGEQLLGMLKN